MATRLYMVANSTPPITPDKDAWSVTTGAVLRMLDTAKAATTEQLTLSIPNTAGQSGLVAQFVSPPLAAQTLSGNVSVVFRARELATNDDVNKRWRSVRVINSAGVTVATLDSLVATSSITELAQASPQGQQHANLSGFTSYTCAAGDRLLVAVGYGTSAGGTSPQVQCEWGGNGTDHTNGNNDTTGTVPWVEFSQNIVWDTTPTTTPVSQTLDLRWQVDNTVSQTVDLRWSSLAAVSASVDLRWSSLAQVSGTLDARWRSLAQAVQTLDARWSVLSRTQADEDLRWRVLSRVTADLDAQWRSAARVVSDVDLRWTATGPQTGVVVASTTPIRQTTAASAVTVAKPAGLAVGDFLLVGFSALDFGVSSAPSGWTLEFSHTAFPDKVYAYSKFADAADVAGSGWTWTLAGSAGSAAGSVRRILGVEPTNAWDSAGSSATDNVNDTTWDVPAVSTVNAGASVVGFGAEDSSAATHTLSAGWTEDDDSGGQSTRGTVSFHKDMPTAGSAGILTITTDIARTGKVAWLRALRPAGGSQPVSADLDARWRVLAQAVQSLDLRWRTAQQVSANADLRWSTLNSVAASADLRWRVLASVAQTVDLRWTVVSSLVSVSQTTDLRWRVAVVVSQSADLRWKVRQQVSRDADLRWTSFAYVAQDLTLLWREVATVAMDLDLLWRRSGYVDAELSILWSHLASTIPLPADVFVDLASQVVGAGLDGYLFGVSLDPLRANGSDLEGDRITVDLDVL